MTKFTSYFVVFFVFFSFMNISGSFAMEPSEMLNSAMENSGNFTETPSAEPSMDSMMAFSESGSVAFGALEAASGTDSGTEFGSNIDGEDDLNGAGLGAEVDIMSDTGTDSTITPADNPLDPGMQLNSEVASRIAEYESAITDLEDILSLVQGDADDYYWKVEQGEETLIKMNEVNSLLTQSSLTINGVNPTDSAAEIQSKIGQLSPIPQQILTIASNIELTLQRYRNELAGLQSMQNQQTVDLSAFEDAASLSAINDAYWDDLEAARNTADPIIASINSIVERYKPAIYDALIEPYCIEGSVCETGATVITQEEANRRSEILNHLLEVKGII